jgi:peptidoglycan/LPS O-acetylase OafA/YrhL
LSSSQPKKNWLEKFRRVTSSTNYLPEVDGLRFLAIFMVAIWMHTTHFIDEKFFGNQLITDPYWRNFIMEGGFGVSIFFMISGFILSLPFAKVHFDKSQDKKNISLKRYYLRRLIRLEPPYIIALVIFLIGNVWVLHKYSFQDLLPHFFASAFYLHNTIYDSFSYVLPIAWSLEVEVQFYLLAPLLCCIYLIHSKYIRWAILFTAIICSGIYNYQFVMGNLAKFFCCFGIGMLVTDFYCTRQKFITSSALCSIIGIVSLLIVLFVPTLTSYTGYWIKFIFSFIFFYTVLTNQVMKKMFSNKYLTVIGGMCYSIYLLHFGILSAGGKILQNSNLLSSTMSLVPLYFILFTTAILLISSVYFLFVEKRFMKMVVRS